LATPCTKMHCRWPTTGRRTATPTQRSSRCRQRCAMSTSNAWAGWPAITTRRSRCPRSTWACPSRSTRPRRASWWTLTGLRSLCS